MAAWPVSTASVSIGKARLIHPCGGVLRNRIPTQPLQAVFESTQRQYHQRTAIVRPLARTRVTFGPYFYSEPPVCQVSRPGLYCARRIIQHRGGVSSARSTRHWWLSATAEAVALSDSHDPDDYSWTEDGDDYFMDDADRPLRVQNLWALQLATPKEESNAILKQHLEEAMKRSRAHVNLVASAVAYVPINTASAVETTWAGTADMLREAAEETRAQVKEKTAKAAAAAAKTPVGRAAKQLREEWEEAAIDLPKDLWGRLMWVWDRPSFQRVRITISMANLSVRLPAIIALVGTQIGLLATQVSLPMLAPLLLGTGMMFRTIKSNASLIFPRVGLLVVLLWVLWFANSVIQNTVMYLRRQGAIDHRVSGAVINASEMCTLGGALVIMLSIIGINVSALLIPAGVAVAIAAKDLSHNFLAGFFLFAVQPFKLGDRVSVSTSVSMPGVNGGPSGGGWFEGVCEKVDLRYTTIKSGRRRLLVPNSAFITREFMILDDALEPTISGRQPESGQAGSLGVRPEPTEWIRRSLESEPFHREQLPQYSAPQRYPYPDVDDDYSGGMHQSEPDSEYEQHGEERWQASGPRHSEQDASVQNSARSERRGGSQSEQGGEARPPRNGTRSSRVRSSTEGPREEQQRQRQYHKGRSPSRSRGDRGGYQPSVPNSNTVRIGQLNQNQDHTQHSSQQKSAQASDRFGFEFPDAGGARDKHTAPQRVSPHFQHHSGVLFGVSEQAVPQYWGGQPASMEQRVAQQQFGPVSPHAQQHHSTTPPHLFVPPELPI